MKAKVYKRNIQLRGFENVVLMLKLYLIKLIRIKLVCKIIKQM